MPNKRQNNRKARRFILGKMRLFILWVILRYGEMHGYKLIRILKQNGLCMAKASRIYPIIRNAEKDGYLIGKSVKSGRRKVRKYKISKKGIKLIKEEKEKVPTIVKEFAKDILAG